MMNYSGNEVSASKVFAGASCLGTTFNNRPAKFLPPVLTLRCPNHCFHHFFELLHIRMVLLAVAFLSYLWNLTLRFAPSRSEATQEYDEYERVFQRNEYFRQIFGKLIFCTLFPNLCFCIRLLHSHSQAIISTMSANEHSRRNNFSSLLLSFRRKELFVFHL